LHAPSSPLARIQDDTDIEIDPALLEEDADAEGEVDDGVGYYVPVRPTPNEVLTLG
jgi:hypothetical protein